MGSRAALLSQLGQNGKAVAIVAATIASYLPIPIVGNLGDLALYALGEQSGAATAAAIAMGLVPGGKLIGTIGSKLGGFVARMGASAFNVAKRYAMSYGPPVFGSIGRGIHSLADKAFSIIGKKSALLLFDPYRALSSSLERTGKSLGRGGNLTKAGRDLVKHGNLIGIENIQKHFGSSATRVNEAAHDVMNQIVGNWTNAVVRENGRVFIPLRGAPNSMLGAIFAADGTFLSFAGKGL